MSCNLLVAETLRSKRRLLGGWICLLSATAASLAYGVVRLQAAPETRDNPDSVLVGSVQVNMGRDVKWDPRFAEIALARLEELSMLASSQGAKIILWPETSIPYRGFRNDPQLTLRMGMLGRVTQSWLIVGSIEMMADEERHTLNSASLIAPDGGFEGRYDKQRLVPGGEYLPFESTLRPFKIFDRVMRYLPGGGNGILTCRLGEGREMRLGLLICFESMVPYLAVQRARDGAQALAVATNDGWFGNTSAITHHFEMAIFRAVETGRPVIQSGNTGISGMIDAYGRVLRETAPDEKTEVVSPLLSTREMTMYVRCGDYVAWLGGLAWLLVASFCRPSQGRSHSLPKAPIP